MLTGLGIRLLYKHNMRRLGKLGFFFIRMRLYVYTRVDVGTAQYTSGGGSQRYLGKMDREKKKNIVGGKMPREEPH